MRHTSFIATALLAIIASPILFASPVSSKHEVEIKFIGITNDSSQETFAFFCRHPNDPPLGKVPPQWVKLGARIPTSNYIVLAHDSGSMPSVVVLQHTDTNQKETLKAGESRKLPE